MDINEELEDIRKLNAIIEAEKDINKGLNFDDSDDSDTSIEESVDTEESESALFDVQDNIKFEQRHDNVPTECLQIPDDNDYNNISFLAPYLNYEEFDLITNCNNEQLKKLLILNRLKNLQLKGLHHKLCNLYTHCTRNIQYIADRKKDTQESIKKKRKIFQVGYPYFKDKQSFPCPANADIYKKRRNHEINIHYLPKRKLWSVFTQMNLKSKISLNYYKNLIEHYNKEIDLRKNGEDCVEIVTKIEQLKDDYANDRLSPPPLWEDTFINWVEVADVYLKSTKSVTICRAYWNLVAHPSINRKKLTESEIDKLKSLTVKYKQQNWELIAEEMGGNRSPFLLCIEFLSNIANLNTSRFTPLEDEMLKQTVEYCRKNDTIHWTKVAYHFSGRTKEQLYHRYAHKNGFERVKQGPFTEDEDVLLLFLAKKYDEHFDKVANVMKHRSKTQLSLRYSHYLKQTFTLGNWTVYDDERILEHVEENGAKCWLKIAYKLNRSSAHCRHRYNLVKRHMDANPLITLENVPRRQTLFANSEEKAIRLNNIVEYYLKNNLIPSLECKMDIEKKPGRPPRSMIDCDLINFFKTTSHSQKYREKKNVDNAFLQQCVASVDLVLKKLDAQLTLPSIYDLYKYSLDELDNSILIGLSDLIPSNSIHCDNLPANIETLQTLKYLLNKFEGHNSKLKVDLMGVDSDVLDCLKKFQLRCKLLFKWPSIMSMQGPPKAIHDDPQTNAKLPPIEKKKRGRPKKNLEKIWKMAAVNSKKRSIKTIQTINDENPMISEIIDEPSSSSPIINPTKRQKII